MKRNGNGIGVLEVVAAIESGNEEALPLGGLEKNRCPVRQPTERPGKNKTPRRRVEVPVARPPEEKKKEGEMKDNNVPATQTRPEFEICPLCGFFNKAVGTAENGETKKFLVCKGCNDKYLAYAKRVADELAAGQKPEVLSKIEWVLSQLNLGRFERELEAARKTRTNAKARIDEMVRVAANGKTLPREVFVALRVKCHQQISQEDYYLVRRLFARLNAAKKLKPELEQMLAKTTAPVAPALITP